jgi:hypothetical protein
LIQVIDGRAGGCGIVDSSLAIPTGGLAAEAGVQMQPVDQAQLITAAAEAAAPILSGAGYALFSAWARLLRRRGFFLAAGASYALLFLATLVLAVALNLDGYWRVLVWLMLAGYLLAPPFVWRLCVGTHAPGHGARP